MALTDPYLPDVDDRIRQSVEYVYSATAYPVTGDPIPLDVEDLSITFDESWSPHIQAAITAKVPEDQATLDRLDPRKNCRVKVSLGYVYDGRVSDVHVVADLHLRTREVLRPANQLRLTASSDEARAQDAKRRSADALPPKIGINEIVAYAAGKAVYPDTAEIVSDFAPGYGVNSFTELALDVGETFDSLITDAAGRAGVWVYSDGSRRWHITTRAAVAGVSAHKLFTGPDGTIFDSDTALQREDFFNSVTLIYKWTDAAKVDFTIYGEAYVPGSGAYGVTATGWNTYVEERQGPITQAQANAAAQTVLKYKVTRGRGIRITSAAAFWLRPGMTVTIQLPLGEQERQIIRAVTFNPSSGSMTITTRQPESVSIS
jgi:hypothetical protein